MRSRSGYAKVDPWTRRRNPAHTDTDHCGRPVGAGRFPPGETHVIRDYSARTRSPRPRPSSKASATRFPRRARLPQPRPQPSPPRRPTRCRPCRPACSPPTGSSTKRSAPGRSHPPAIREYCCRARLNSYHGHRRGQRRPRPPRTRCPNGSRSRRGVEHAASPAASPAITSCLSIRTRHPPGGVEQQPGSACRWMRWVTSPPADSDLIGMGGGGLMTALAGPSTASADFGGLGTALAGDVGPGAAAGRCRWPGGMGAAPVLAAAGRGSSIGPLSVPPSWAGGAGIPAGSTPVTLASQSYRRRTRRGCRPGLRAPWPACLRSPTAVAAAARASAPRATASSPRSCRRFPSRDLEIQAANGGQTKPQTHSDQLRDGIKKWFLISQSRPPEVNSALHLLRRRSGTADRPPPPRSAT